MATKAQREARRRYALKRVRELTQPSKLAMVDIAEALNDQQIPTPLGTTEWTARLVSALLICDAFECDPYWENGQDDTILLWSLNSSDVRKYFRYSVRYNALIGKFWSKNKDIVGAFKALYGELLLTEDARTWELLDYPAVGSITADAMVALPPEVEAFRDFALDVVRELRDRPWSYSAVASVLTRREVPTLDGKTTWRHNQVERLVTTSGDTELMRLVTSQTADMYKGLERMEQSEPEVGQSEPHGFEGQDVPF